MTQSLRVAKQRSFKRLALTTSWSTSANREQTYRRQMSQPMKERYCSRYYCRPTDRSLVRQWLAWISNIRSTTPSLTTTIQRSSRPAVCAPSYGSIAKSSTICRWGLLTIASYLTSGYYQIRISDEDAPNTASTTPMGQIEFIVLGIGLANAPAAFQAV